jgi:hypothetical protein
MAFLLAIVLVLFALSPSERRLRAQFAAYTRWAHEDPTHNAVRGQAGLSERFLREVCEANPDLPPAELAQECHHP